MLSVSNYFMPLKFGIDTVICSYFHSPLAHSQWTKMEDLTKIKNRFQEVLNIVWYRPMYQNPQRFWIQDSNHLDSGFRPSGFWILTHWILDSNPLDSGFWIHWIPDSKSNLDSRFHHCGFQILTTRFRRIPDSVTWVEVTPPDILSEGTYNSTSNGTKHLYLAKQLTVHLVTAPNIFI